MRIQDDEARGGGGAREADEACSEDPGRGDAVLEVAFR